MRIDSLSLEPVCVPVSASLNGQDYDPTSGTVTIAFPAAGVKPVIGDYNAASWESGGPPYVAYTRVGPGGTKTLADGVYDVWVKVAIGSDVVQRHVDTLIVE